MLKTIIIIKNWLVRLLETAVILITGILVLDVVWQVFTRFILNDPSSWTEELATMLLIWVSLLGASVGFMLKSHLGVDYFVHKLPPRYQILTDILVYVIVAFFAVSVMLYGGYRLVYLTLITNQRSPALGIKMGYVYLALPISGFFITIFSIETIVVKIDKLRK